MSNDLNGKVRVTYPHARWKRLPLGAVSLTKGFWARRQLINREVTLLHGYKMMEEAGNFQNLQIAAGLEESEYQGREFLDSDVYKWLEAASYELHLEPDNPPLQQRVDRAIDLIVAAQESDGYINSYFQVEHQGKRWNDLDFGHELYCAGHLFQAAVAHHRATQSRKLLDVATRFADLLCATFGPDKKTGAPGHPVVEMALVALYRLTHKEEYLDLAKFFVDQRGKGKMPGIGWADGPAYHQDRVPIREASKMEGHAVRAMYLYSGVTDLYLETGESALLDAVSRLWRDMVEGKLFITGGVGARYEGESFGDPYELPPDQCYCETCAAVGSIMWNWRMLLASGESRYADLIERTLYNGFLSGLAHDGRRFFYTNPLMSRYGAERQEWYKVACCPPNIMRLLASLGQYLATADATGIQLHLYASASVAASLPSGSPAALTIDTRYPWNGNVRMNVESTDGSSWVLRLRVPGWSEEVKVLVNGQPVEDLETESGYALLERAWQADDMIEVEFPMEPRLVEPHPRIDAVRDSVAIQYGPLVYCLEEEDATINLMDVRLDENVSLEAVWREDVLAEGVVAVQAAGGVNSADEWGGLYRPLDEGDLQKPAGRMVSLGAIPYYAWGNRALGAMRVWIPRMRRAEESMA